jgi:hypothetical protein
MDMDVLWAWMCISDTLITVHGIILMYVVRANATLSSDKIKYSHLNLVT